MTFLPKRYEIDLGFKNECLDQAISEVELQAALQKCKNGKAVGLDGISYEILKNANVSDLLLKILNIVFQSRKIPDAWRRSSICPIPKADSVDTEPASFRGLSLQSCVYKVYSSILNARINCFLENIHYDETKPLLSESQNGFRVNRGCLDNIFVLTNLVHEQFVKKESLYACFIDFKKAFDVIDRSLLNESLKTIGLTEHMCEVIGNVYENTWNCVQIGAHQSRWFATKAGVKQGDPLSPTLFSVFINSLLEELNDTCSGLVVNGINVSVLAYADDIVIVARSEQYLQALLDKLDTWCGNWKMSVNMSKTKIIVFNKQGSKTCCLRLHGSTVEVVKCYKYLGVTFDERCSFQQHLEQALLKGRQALGRVYKLFHCLRKPNYHTFERLYKCIVVPTVTYGMGIWGAHLNQQQRVAVDRLMYQAQRWFLCVPRRVPQVGVGVYLWMEKL